MKAAQQEHKHTDRNTNVKDRQRTELSKDIKTRIHVYETKVFSLLKIQSKPTQHPVLCYAYRNLLQQNNRPTVSAVLNYSLSVLVFAILLIAN